MDMICNGSKSNIEHTEINLQEKWEFKMTNIKWLFFDVGSTLVNESHVYNNRLREAIKGTNISFEQAYKKAILFAKANHPEPLKCLGLSLPSWKNEYEFVDPCAKKCLSLLHRKYKIGIIANQPKGTAERMLKYGLYEYLDLIISSAEEKVAKPDERIFKLALERSKCIPEESIMIGDRLDNDIAPAKRLGMATIWIRQGFGGMATPTKEDEYPDFEIYQLMDLCKILLS